ncbi:hypothetical protein BRC81_13165 [Halobacteriales archaeon QS_1_68_20]|nr:MAG: hypothetical protein BRC81_13165 [Halobacteriales archaeon QS_1_68_20]
MKRRRVIRGIAATGAIGSTAGLAAGNQIGQPTDISAYDHLKVVRGDETVRTIDDPSWETVREVELELDEDEELVGPECHCVTYCCNECSCSDGCCACNCWCECPGENECTC